MGLHGRQAKVRGVPAMLERNSLFWRVKDTLRRAAKGSQPALDPPPRGDCLRSVASAERRPRHGITHSKFKRGLKIHEKRHPPAAAVKGPLRAVKVLDQIRAHAPRFADRRTETLAQVGSPLGSE